ncbi:MAG TPA: lytic transglycosylase domain-containing protein [Streptosporangiaceae bacterium]
MTAAIGATGATIASAAGPAGRPPAAASSATAGARTAIKLDTQSGRTSAAADRSAVQAQLTSSQRTRRGPRAIARILLRRHGFKRWQFRPLNRLWTRESSWSPRASNPYSGAYGIPQAVPGSKMASAGGHWRTNAWTQIRWGLRYIRGRYRSPRRAWLHEVRTGWY